MIEAKEILASENPSGDRLMTMWCRYPKFIHGEHLRHRSFSFSVSSSRAIPVSKNLEEVRSDELRAAPVWWGREQKGMQSGEELEGGLLQYAKSTWAAAAYQATVFAADLQDKGVHKSIVNRILEPFLHVNVLVTGTTAGWMNFFGLRLDRAAQPEIRALAEAQWRVWNESKPQRLEPGQWHLPFVDEDEVCHTSNPLAIWTRHDWIGKNLSCLEIAKRISVARCARLSYTSFETGRRSTIEEDLALYDRLVGSKPIHASPAEHQATPDELSPAYDGNPPDVHPWKWLHRREAGNLGPGWRQLRKMLPDEAVAPLPREYQQK